MIENSPSFTGGSIFLDIKARIAASAIKIKIGKNVTIGLNSTILPGVEIGDNSVIGAGSLVLPNTKIGKNEFWAGVPAKKVKNL